MTTTPALASIPLPTGGEIGFGPIEYRPANAHPNEGTDWPAHLDVWQASALMYLPAAPDGALDPALRDLAPALGERRGEGWGWGRGGGVLPYTPPTQRAQRASADAPTQVAAAAEVRRLLSEAAAQVLAHSMARASRLALREARLAEGAGE